MIFRDYGLYDHAMLRFSRGHKISEHFYVRQDGTRAYYFTLGETITQIFCMGNLLPLLYLPHLVEEVSDLFEGAGFESECRYVQRETVNHKEGIHAKRIFVQGKFRKKRVADASRFTPTPSTSDQHRESDTHTTLEKPTQK